MKVVIVKEIDEMPTDCDSCPFQDFSQNCGILGEYTMLNYWMEDAPYYDLVGKGDCPLRPLPKKFNEGIEYDMDGFGFDKYLETGFKMGWDAYYDKITKNHIGENTEKVCNDDLYENWMFFDKGETE